ncbi:MAG: phage tail protein [Negativicutes bacterium]|nr:phage tail protein [Negativicutes bacterium]
MANRPLAGTLPDNLKANWQLDDTVMPADTNNWGGGINALADAVNAVNAAFDALMTFTGGNLTGAINEKSVTLASAATLNIGAAGGNVIIVTGNTGITAFDAPQAGTRRLLRFAGALTLTNSINLILPGAQNLLVGAGDAVMMTSLGGGAWWGQYIPANPIYVPTGAIVHYPATIAPAGFIKANGATLSRATYANLWAYAQASGNLVSDATWSANNWGNFSTGDLATTFRIPDLRGEFIRNIDDGRGVNPAITIGSANTDTGRNATGSLTALYFNSGTATGVFASVDDSNWGVGSGGYAKQDTTFDLSRVWGSHIGNEFSPRSIGVLACIKY